MVFILEQTINRLKKALEQKLPGQDAQYLMAPQNRERIERELMKTGQYKPSAVMILFCEDEEGRLFIPLTERRTYDGAHSGQVSLPGGKYDAADGDLSETARRECYEEIGVSELEILGKLTELHIPVSGFLVQPFVGYCKLKNPEMIQHQREVKQILKLELNHLLDDASIEQGTIEISGNLKIKTPWFDVQGYRVWGATAMILSELKELMKTIS